MGAGAGGAKRKRKVKLPPVEKVPISIDARTTSRSMTSAVFSVYGGDDGKRYLSVVLHVFGTGEPGDEFRFTVQSGDNMYSARDVRLKSRLLDAAADYIEKIVRGDK